MPNPLTVRSLCRLGLAVLSSCLFPGPIPAQDAREGSGSHRHQILEAPLPAKSIAIYVGRNLTADGSVLLGGFGHEPSSHWYEITPARRFPQGTTVEVGITDEARIPGRRFRIPQVPETFRFVTTNYSEFAGFPPPLTNGGLNERGVAARDVWSPSRSELREMTPRPQVGLSYSDLSRIAMERATSSREAVEILGRLMDEHGYATYGGNSHLFADSLEGWVVINYAGGQGLWAAERLGADEVRVSYPGYIGEFPLDFQDSPNYMGSDNIVSFAIEQGWWNPEGDEPFNLHEVYGQPFPSAPGQEDPHTLFRYPPMLEDEVAAMAPISVADMMALVRDPRWSNDGSGYGQVAHLRGGLHPELGVLWMSITGAVASPFVPIWLGVQDIPPEYKQHRYMTKASDWAFLDPTYAPLEGTASAFRVHKRLLYHTCAHPEEFLKPVTAELETFEARLLADQLAVEEAATARFNQGDPEAARTVLTEYTGNRLQAALRLGQALADGVEEEIRQHYGIRMPEVETPEGASWLPESEAMIQRPGNTYHRCFRAGLESYPRRHDSYGSLASDSLIQSVLAAPRQRSTGPGAGVPGLVGMSLLFAFLGLLVGLGVGRYRAGQTKP